MSSGSKQRIDLVPVPEHARVEVPGGPQPAPEVIATANVVPFVRPQRAGAALVLEPSRRPAPELPPQEGRGRIVILLSLSLLLHGGLLAMFNRAPEPMASIALPAISVEIVLGADTPAGVAMAAAQREEQTTPAEDPAEKPAEDPAEKPADPATETAQQETSPTEVTSSVQPSVAETAPVPPDVADPRSTEPQAAKPEPQPKPVQPRAVKPKQEHAAKPKQAEPRTRTANLEHAAPASSSASGFGIGHTGTDTNYRGLVFAHLARHKQFPADARSRGEQGSAMVTFSLDGSGRVTRVSLVRGSGIASLDQEAQAMVRRASPFPAPPDGRPVSFTAPATFRLQ
jgi:TonB family protein